MMLDTIRQRQNYRAKEGAKNVFKALFMAVVTFLLFWFYVVIAFTW